MADFFGTLTDMFGGILSSMKSFVYAIPIIVVGLVVAVVMRNRMAYNYPVRIFRMRENGKVLETNCKGGYVKRKNSAPYFRIKTGFFWWQKIDLTTTPKPEHIDEQNRIYYKQIDVGSFAQVRREFNDEGVTYKPVESDVMYGAILSIQKIRDVTAAQDKMMKYAAWGVLALMVVVHLVIVLVVLKMQGG